MIKIELISSNLNTATFKVDGATVTREIAEGIPQETLQEHLESIAQGLVAEVRHAKVLNGTAPFAEEEIITL